MTFLNLNNLSVFVVLLFFLVSLLLLWRGFLKKYFFNKSDLALMRNYEFFNFAFLLKNIFLALSILFLGIAFLRPAWGLKESKTVANGIDLIFTLDVSKSMLSVDTDAGAYTGARTHAYLSRLDNAKKMIADFVNKNPQNRYGLIIFAGEAFVSTPLTIDHQAFLTFLNNVDSQDVAGAGTNLSEALKMSIDRFYAQKDKKRGRAIVLLSDGGEDFDENLDDLAKLLKDLNIKLITIGVGGSKEVPIPNGQDLFGRTTYKRYRGKVVMTKLNDKNLKKIAKKAGGKYYHFKNPKQIEKINADLKNLKASKIFSKNKSGKEDRYQIFLFLSFLFFLLYLFLPLNKKNYEFLFKLKIAYLQIAKKYFKIFVLILIPFILSSCSNSQFLFKHYLGKGNKYFYKNNYKKAIENYQKSANSNYAQKYIALNNKAIADYKMKNFNKAKEELEKQINIFCSPKPKEYCDELYYNLGNTYYRLGENNKEKRLEFWQKAIKAYEDELKIKDDKKAQENIDFIKEKLKQEQKSANQNKEEGQGQNKSKQENNQKGKNQNNKNGKEGENEEENENSGKKGEEKKSQNQKNSSESDKQNLKNSAQKDNAKEKESKAQAEQKQGQGLDKKTEEKLDQYLQKLEQEEKQNQRYFKQNPNAQDNSSPFDDFFDDDFFDFGFGDLNKDDSEIDW